MEKRFVIDKRVGIIAILDTLHDSYENRTNGLHGDSDYVVASWHGKVEPRGIHHIWQIEEWKIEKANKLLELLNRG